jgi:hypothetical protein
MTSVIPVSIPWVKALCSKKNSSALRIILGPDYWSFSFQDWSFVGLNSEIMGSGLKEEGRMMEELKEALSHPKLVVFSHRPWFLLSSEENKINPKACLPTGIRDRLFQLTHKAKELWVFSGHRHASKEIHFKQKHFIGSPAPA